MTSARQGETVRRKTAVGSESHELTLRETDLVEHITQSTPLIRPSNRGGTGIRSEEPPDNTAVSVGFQFKSADRRRALLLRLLSFEGIQPQQLADLGLHGLFPALGVPDVPEDHLPVAVEQEAGRRAAHAVLI